MARTVAYLVALVAIPTLGSNPRGFEQPNTNSATDISHEKMEIASQSDSNEEALASLIVDASYRAADRFRDFIDDSFPERKRAAKYHQIASEFLFAFLDMTDRAMFTERGAAFRETHINSLAARVIHLAAHRQSPHADAQTLETAVALLQLDANDAHAAYQGYSEVFVGDKPFTGKGVANRLARYVCRDLDSANNIELHRRAIVAFADLSEALNLRKIVAAF